MGLETLTPLLWLAAVGLAAVSGMSAYTLIRMLTLARRVHRTRVPPGRMPGRYVKLQGVARPYRAPLTAPLSGQRCAWWWVQVGAGGARRRHDPGHGLLLDIDGELIEVCAAEAQMHPAQMERFDARRDPFTHPDTPIWEQHPGRRRRGPVHLCEWRVADGDPLLVTGWLDIHNGRMKLSRRGWRRPLFIARGDEAQLARTVVDAGDQLIRGVMLPAAAACGLVLWGLLLAVL